MYVYVYQGLCCYSQPEGNSHIYYCHRRQVSGRGRYFNQKGIETTASCSIPELHSSINHTPLGNLKIFELDTQQHSCCIIYSYELGNRITRIEVQLWH